MPKVNKKLLASIFLVFIMLVFLLPNFCFAAELDTGLSYVEDIGLGDDDPRIIIARVVRIALGFLGIIAVGFIMYAGWLYMTSDGEETQINEAKDVLKNALIGLIIILASFGIASFILNKLMGLGGAGSGSGNDYGGGSSWGTGALGACSIESVYPEPGQTNPEVSRNTSIIVTFREEVDPTTICNDAGGNNNGICESGEYIISDNIKIFHTNEASECSTFGGTCTSLVTEVNVKTHDNKTFVFMPVSYLGSPSEYIWHTVYLSNNILKKSDSSGIFDDCLSDFFEWTFEVSNKVDLTPPQVRENDVFPNPDNLRDSVSVSSASSQASGSINIKNNPNIYTIASVGSATPQGGSELATVSGTYTCINDGTITASIVSGTPNSVNVSGVVGVVSGDDVSDGAASLGCGLTLSPNDGSFTVGNSWAINVIAEKSADNLTIGNNIYTFISGSSAGNNISRGATASVTATNIVSALSSNTEVSAVLSGTIINLTAVVAGTAGNNIALNSSSIYSATNTSGAFEFTAMSGGSSSVSTTVINGKKDKPRNAVVQLNFNEAIMPISISGSADNVKDSLRIINYLSVNGEACSNNLECASSNCVSSVCSGVPTLLSNNASCSANRECKSFKCEASVCVGDYLNGEYKVSNIYRTVEFISDNKCGTNACGESIYCLPENSRLKVEVIASSLESCSSDVSCVSRSPYNTCEACGNCNASNKTCRDNGINYPLSDMTSLSGVMDVSLNSLDGNRDDDADGPLSYFNENNSTPDLTTGDNFTWSFFINDTIDLTPPEITSTMQENSTGVEGYLNQGATDANLANPILIRFSKLMMSSSLSTGSTIINNGQDNVEHQLINIWNNTSTALGYWTSKENIDNSSPLDGEPDYTKTYLKHTLFSDTTSFRTQAGSGIKCIYQNCFKPSDGPACTGINASNPSCCSGVVSSSSSCP